MTRPIGGVLGARNPPRYNAGTGADGSLSTSGNVSLGTGDDDSAFLELNYTSLTINAGHTVTTAGRRRALIIRVQGNCVINGTLSMTARGAAAATASSDTVEQATKLPSGIYTIDELEVVRLLASLSMVVPKLGAKGGIYSLPYHGRDGDAGSNGSCGGGGSGGIGGGNGGDANAWSGGSGGGGGLETNFGSSFTYVTGGGGVGNPGGAAGLSVGTGPGNASGSGAGGKGTDGGGAFAVGSGGVGNNGTGGVIILIVGGNLTIGSTGIISANGVTCTSDCGGASGAGSILITYAGTLSNTGTIQANGGTGGGGVFWDGVTSVLQSGQGGSGGAGSIQLQQALVAA